MKNNWMVPEKSHIPTRSCILEILEFIGERGCLRLLPPIVGKWIFKGTTHSMIIFL